MEGICNMAVMVNCKHDWYFQGKKGEKVIAFCKICGTVVRDDEAYKIYVENSGFYYEIDRIHKEIGYAESSWHDDNEDSKATIDKLNGIIASNQLDSDLAKTNNQLKMQRDTYKRNLQSTFDAKNELDTANAELTKTIKELSAESEADHQAWAKDLENFGATVRKLKHIITDLAELKCPLCKRRYSECPHHYKDIIELVEKC